MRNKLGSVLLYACLFIISSYFNGARLSLSPSLSLPLYDNF